MTDRYASRAIVLTDAAPRYAKQLAAHLGRKAEVRPNADGPHIVLPAGSCRLVCRDHALELWAGSDTPEGLKQIEHVVGSHLERFGQRNGLTVRWTSSD